MPSRCEMCKKYAVYGYEENGLMDIMRCVNHKLDDMELLIIKTLRRKCHYEGCKTSASYGYDKEDKILYCAKHKLPLMNDVIHYKCAYPG